VRIRGMRDGQDLRLDSRLDLRPDSRWQGGAEAAARAAGVMQPSTHLGYGRIGSGLQGARRGSVRIAP